MWVSRQNQQPLFLYTALTYWSLGVLYQEKKNERLMWRPRSFVRLSMT